MRRAAIFRRAVCLAAALGAAGCAPTYANHGFAPQIAELDALTAGADTRGSVLRKLGRPSSTSTFDSDVWYYVASRTEKFAFYQPKVVDRTVAVVRFDEFGVVTQVDRYGLEDGRIVSLVTSTTPTFGRELSVLQQIFSNVGKVDASQVLNR